LKLRVLHLTSYINEFIKKEKINTLFSV